MKIKICKKLMCIILILCMISLSSCGVITQITPTSATTQTETNNPATDKPDNPNIPSINVVGIGESVNLLKGSYTDFASGTISIFNKELFNNLPKNEANIKMQNTNIVCHENLLSYIDHISNGVSSKIGMTASVGYAGIAKATAGFTFSIDKKYEKKTQDETKCIFYDMEYMFIDKRVEIQGYNDTSKLAAVLSDEFLNDALKIQNGDMTAKDFISKYGTHVVTSGIYGAKFNLHYEMITDSSIASTTFGTDIKTEISTQIDASIYGVDVGIGSSSSTEVNYSAFQSNTSSDMQTRFNVKAVGGSPTAMMAESLSQFSTICQSWADGINNPENHVIIDVPDGSLFFVWDYLGQEYIGAKNILNHYFYSECDESYYALKDKVSSIYRDSFIFDDITGTLHFNLSGLQDYDSASLEGVNYTMNGLDIFDNETGVLTVFPQYDGKEVKKIVFEGSYLTKDKLGRKISTIFTPFTIKLDQWWENDVVIEFKNFAFEAGANNYAIDLSHIHSSTVAVNVEGNSYIKGGNSNYNAYIAINAPNKCLCIGGNGSILIEGGDGFNGSFSGADGKNGATAIVANEIIFDIIGEATIIGGNGGNGVSGKYGTDGKSYVGHDDRNETKDGANGGNGTDGQDGGNAGKGGYAYEAEGIILSNGSIIAIGGKSGNGGFGGNGGKGGKGQESGGWGTKAGNGGNGGDGGNGGNTYIVAASDGSENITTIAGTLELINGEAGTPGGKAYGGRGGAKGMHCDAENCGQFLTKGSDGSPGYNGSDGIDGTIVYIP